MTDSLFEAVALCSKELMKYSLSAEEFAVLAQKNGMTDSEILAVSKTFEYLRDKKKRESVEFLLRTSRLPLKAPKTFDNFDFNRITGKNVEKLRSLSTLSTPTRILPLLASRERERPTWPRHLAGPAVNRD